MKKLLPFIILTFIVLFYTRGYFHPGFFPTHDGEWAIVRLAEMEREIKDGQIPPRWSDYLNHGYGYPLFSFTYPFPFYLGIFFRFLHIGLVDAVKIIFVGSVLLSAFFMFFLGKELAGSYAGLLSAIFYIVAPFRLVNLYARGSIGECLSFALFPLLFFLGLIYVLKPNIQRLAACSVCLAVLILSHNVMSFVFFPFFLVFLFISALFYSKDPVRYSWRYFLAMVLLGLGLSAYFFLPALLEKRHILLSQIQLANVNENFINFPDYFFSPWGYGIKPSFQLGWTHIVGGVISFLGVLTAGKIYKKKYLPLALFILVSISILIFLTLPISSALWNLPLLSWLDFPWRLLSPLTFFLAFSTIFLSVNKSTKIIGSILVLIVSLSNLKMASPSSYFNKPDIYYATNDATTTSADELMPIWVIDKPRERYQVKVEIENGNAIIGDLSYNSHHIGFRLSSQLPSTVKVNTVYFPGWKFYLEREEVDLDYSRPDGLMRFKIPPGDFQVEGKFSETPVRLMSDIISLASFVVLLRLIGFSLFPSKG